jgi:NAD(P)-dependent dehydrogenase (short-subunit alcohol dehydrogenase family)
MSNNLTGTTALITGGSKGIGLGIAEALVDLGANVAITARTASEVEAAAEALTARGGGVALGVACDVRDLAAQERAVTQTVERFGGLDALIANAGVGHFGLVEDMTPDDWQAMIDTNLTGVFYSVKAALDPLKRSRGTIVTIGSLAGTNFFRGGSGYNATKFGLTGFSQAIMLDLRHHGIRVSTIMPGSVATHFGGQEPGEKDAWKIQPEDIGAMVVYLLTTPARTLPSKIEVRPSQPPQS